MLVLLLQLLCLLVQLLNQNKQLFLVLLRHLLVHCRAKLLKNFLHALSLAVSASFPHVFVDLFSCIVVRCNAALVFVIAIIVLLLLHLIVGRRNQDFRVTDMRCDFVLFVLLFIVIILRVFVSLLLLLLWCNNNDLLSVRFRNFIL